MGGHLCRSMEWRKELERSPRDFFGRILWAGQLLVSFATIWNGYKLVRSTLSSLCCRGYLSKQFKTPQMPRLSAFLYFQSAHYIFCRFLPLCKIKKSSVPTTSPLMLFCSILKKDPPWGDIGFQHRIRSRLSVNSIKGGASSIPPIQRRRPTVRIFPSYILALSSLKAAREKSPHRSDVIYWM